MILGVGRKPLRRLTLPSTSASQRARLLRLHDYLVAFPVVTTTGARRRFAPIPMSTAGYRVKASFGVSTRKRTASVRDVELREPFDRRLMCSRSCSVSSFHIPCRRRDCTARP